MIPTISVSSPEEFFLAKTLAPTSGAYPNPGVDPNETTKPPLGIWFWFISNSDSTGSPLIDVMPVNTILDTPFVESFSKI